MRTLVYSPIIDSYCMGGSTQSVVMVVGFGVLFGFLWG